MLRTSTHAAGEPIVCIAVDEDEGARSIDPSPLIAGCAPLDEDIPRNVAQRDPNSGVRAHELRASPNLADQDERTLLAELGDRFAQLFQAVSVSPEKVDETVDALEERAVEVLESFMPKAPGGAERAFETWFVDVEQRATSGDRINAMEYLTILHLVRTGLFDASPEMGEYVPRMKQTLMKMRERLVGDEVPLEKIGQRTLPKLWLAEQNRDVQAIHGAIFRPNEESFRAAMKDLYQTYIPRKHDPAIAIGLIALCFTNVGQQLLAGAVHGYLQGTFMEHTIHKYMGHASKRSLERLDRVLSRFGPIGKSIHRFVERTAYSHGTIHHGSYAGSYVDRFAPRDPNLPPEVIDQKRKERKEKMDAMIHKRDPQEAADIYASDYGRRLAHAIQDALIVMPFSAGMTLANSYLLRKLGFDTGGLFLAASVAFSILYVPASNYLHPNLHRTREKANRLAGKVMQKVLKSRYVAHVARSHYVHHHDAHVNQNLVPGADYVLGYKSSPVETVLALRRLKTFY
jgi:hypothetical protein